jgi:phage baseplate assembly protein W
MLPDFAFNGYNILFEPITKESGSIIGSLIWQSIEKWDERVEINNIHVDLKPDEHQYVIYIYYHILNITSETEPDVVRIVLTQL